MKQPYLGDPDRAHRLNAARRAAGFSSVQAAAMRFGWSLATYRGHEGATRRLSEAAARRYAEAFQVDFHWLWDAQGRGPTVDASRVEKYRLREKLLKRKTRGDPREQAHIRIRIARRLAGLGSISEAARHLKLSKSTVSSHESGQSRPSRAAAAIYAAGYGTLAEWLRTGQLPSGYPAAIEKRLDELAKLHDESDAVAGDLFPRSPPLRSFSPPVTAHEKAPPPESGDTVPEFSGSQIMKGLPAGGSDTSKLRPLRTWWFPQGFLRDVMAVEPAFAVVVTARNGDRIIVDISMRTPVLGKTFLIINALGVSTAPSPQPDQPILGRACGAIVKLY